MKKILALVLMAVLFLTACSPPADTPSETTRRDTISVATPADFTMLDPAFMSSAVDMNIVHAVFDSLVSVHQDGEVVPELAESFEMSDDGTEYTFKIRQGVKFHNGADLDASDVQYSLERSIASPYMALFSQYIKETEQVDDYTVKITLNAASTPFLMLFSNQFAVVDKDTTEEAGESFKDFPIGTGPYKYVERKPGESLSLTANEEYWGDKAEVKNVVFRVISDPSNALIALENGDIDVCYYVPPASLSLVRENDELEIHDISTSGLTFVTMNVQKEGFDNPKVRQALSYAMDKQSIVDGAQEGEAVVADTMINNVFHSYPETLDGVGYTYDMDKAKELLAEAGYPNGEGFPSFMIQTYDLGKKTAELVMANLTDLGLTCDIEILEINAFFQSFGSGDMEMGVITAGLGDDASSMNVLLTEGAPYNMSWYSNPKVTELFEKGVEEFDVEKRKVIFDELYRIVKEDAPYIPLYFNKYNFCHRADLNLDNYTNFAQTHLDGIKFD